MLEKRILGHQQNKVTQISHIQPSENITVLKKRENNARFKKIILGSMVLVFIVFFGIQFLKAPNLLIKKINIAGVRTVDPVYVQDFARQYIQKTNIIGVPIGNTLIFNEKKLAASVMDQFASFKSVRVFFSNPYEITISVDEFTPEYLWCDQLCLMVNHQGYLYQYATDFTPGSFVVFRGGLAHTDYELRNNIFVSDVEKSFFEMLQQVLDENQSRIVSVDNINTDSVFITVDILNSNILENKAQIRVDKKLSKDYFNTILTILNNDKVFKNNLLNHESLDYIDLRYPEKIFYKFSNRPQISVPNANTEQIIPSEKESPSQVVVPKKQT